MKKFVIASMRGPSKETWPAFVEKIREAFPVLGMLGQTGPGCFNLGVICSKENVEKLTYALMPAKYAGTNDERLKVGTFEFID